MDYFYFQMLLPLLIALAIFKLNFLVKLFLLYQFYPLQLFMQIIRPEAFTNLWIASSKLQNHETYLRFADEEVLSFRIFIG